MEPDLVVRRNGWVGLWGRIFLSFIFVVSGLSKIPGWQETSQYMEQQGMPVVPFLLFCAIAVEVVCGFMLLVGFRARLAALLLGLYLVPVSLVFHDFWTFSGMERQLQMINFIKNFAIIGGLLMVAANGPGALSVDGIRSRRTRLPVEERPKLRRVS